MNDKDKAELLELSDGDASIMVEVEDQGTCHTVSFVAHEENFKEEFIVDSNEEVYIEPEPGDWLKGKGHAIMESQLKDFIRRQVRQFIAEMERSDKEAKENRKRGVLPTTV